MKNPHLTKIRVGDRLITDDGLSCIRGVSRIVTIKSDANGLYFDCEDGRHYLSGQTDADGHLVGMNWTPLENA